MFEPSVDSTLAERPCPFITFYSFKGGVGRSMAVINVAGIMASRGLRVMVVDMDLEAPGLSFLAHRVQGEGRPPQRGFVDFILDAVERGADGDLFQLTPEDAILRYSSSYELPEGFRRSPDGSLRIMPAGQIDDGYAERLTRLDLPSLYHEGTGLALIQAFKQVVQDAKLFDYVFIDSRTGFSDESGICTRDLADCLMVVSGLNRQNVEGTTRFLSTLRRATEGRKPLAVILSPIPNGEDALVDEREARAQEVFREAWGEPVPTELHIPYHPQLALTEEPHIFRRRRGYLFEAYNRIEQSVLRLLGETWDVVFRAALTAFRDKDYAKAEAGFRRVDKLTGSQEWIDGLMLSTDPAQFADAGAEAILGLIAERANPRAKIWIGEWIGRTAHLRQKKNPKVAKALYERSLDMEPNNAVILHMYAGFLWKEKKDEDAAEAIIRRALEINSDNARHLIDYANFFWVGRRDIETAEAIFECALKIDPDNATILGSNAGFLWKGRGDTDAAAAMFERALKADPDNATVLASNAGFLWEERKDTDAAAAMFERALKAEPDNATALGSNAVFLWKGRKDTDAAEAMFERALKAAPGNAVNLQRYAHFLWRERKDTESAEAMFKRALAVDPGANMLGNYGWFYLSVGRIAEGMELVDRALTARKGNSSPESIDAVCWMYVYCCGEPERRIDALRQLRTVLEAHDVSTGDWDFNEVIAQARTMAHPEAAWLPVLADVLGGRRPPAALEDWPAWRMAAPH